MRLYKYLHPDRTDVLSRQRIRFTPPLALNDPFELKPNITALASSSDIDDQLLELTPKIFDEELAKLPPEIRNRIPRHILNALMAEQMPRIREQVKSAANALSPRIRDKMEKTFERMLGVLCLSERIDSLLMWAHYADSHRGFLIEFDPLAEFFDRRRSPQDELRHLRKVRYSNKRPSSTLFELEDYSSFMTKGLEWEYEAEWRITQTFESADQVIGSGLDPIHLFCFAPETVKSVVFGCKMSETKRLEISQILKETPGYSEVSVQRAEVDQTEYRLNFLRADA